MAGAFGYENDHYDVGIRCGERVLLPAVRNAPRDSLIVADGFSCREQISQQTDRKALHLAQVLQMALHDGPNGPAGEAPEAGYSLLEKTPAVPASVAGGFSVLAAAGLWWILHSHKRN